jgi:hypothetical protein
MDNLPAFTFDDFKNHLYGVLIQKYLDYGISQMNDQMFQATAVIDIKELARLAKKRGDALTVIVKTPAIFEWLRESDPEALKQCLEAVGATITESNI